MGQTAWGRPIHCVAPHFSCKVIISYLLRPESSLPQVPLRLSPDLPPLLGATLHTCLAAAEAEAEAGASGSRALRLAALQAVRAALPLLTDEVGRR